MRAPGIGTFGVCLWSATAGRRDADLDLSTVHKPFDKIPHCG